MRTTTKVTIAALSVIGAIAWILWATVIAATWLTPDVITLGLVILSTAIVTSLLFVYFDWRGRLRRRVLATRSTGQSAREEKLWS